MSSPRTQPGGRPPPPPTSPLSSSSTCTSPSSSPRGKARRRKSLCDSFLKERQDAVNGEIFSAFLAATGEPGPTLRRRSLLRYLRSQGLQDDDERLSRAMKHLGELGEDLSPEDVNLIGTDDALVTNVVWKAIHGRLIIPDFPSFTAIIRDMYEETLLNKSGKNADYIPQLATVNPDQFGVAVCTCDGQRYAIGDVNVPFCVQSCSKVVTYAIAQTLHGADVVHRHVGVEPSGRAFNQMVLDERAKTSDLRARRECMERGDTRGAEGIEVRPAVPHNPCINAGAIMCASLVLPGASAAERFDYVMGTWERLCGCHPGSHNLRRPTFATSTYLSERSTADRNRCLAYMMSEEGAFLPGTDIMAALDSYFMYCSIECTVHTLSVIAATFANGGTCPASGVRVFDHEVVRNCLSVMESAGMYDYSGTFAYRMGFPSKSGVGGALLIVIPGVCGFCTWSPRLDEIGNSARGVHFCRLLSERFAFHMFAPHPASASATADGNAVVNPDAEVLTIDGGSDYLAKLTPKAKMRRQRSKTEAKVDPRRRAVVKEEQCTDVEATLDLIWAAKDGDVTAVRQFIARGWDVNGYDYDLRTALHLAACCGHVDMLKYLLRLGAEPLAIDNFGGSPLSDARRKNRGEANDEIVALLETAIAKDEESDDDTNTQHRDPLANVGKVANDVYRSLIALLDPTSDVLTTGFLFEVLAKSGIRREDGRLKAAMKGLPSGLEPLTPQHIEKVTSSSLLLRALQGRLVVPDWGSFSRTCSKCFETARLVNDGKVADYIPILSKADPDKFGVSVCSVDGQRFSIGDTMQEFGVQSSMKPVNHAIALETTSFRKVYQHVGIEPSGRPFNEMVLDWRRVDGDSGGHSFPVKCDDRCDDNDDFVAKYDDSGSVIKPTAVPHNPLINSGAIMCCSIIDEGEDVASKMSTVRRYWERLTGGTKEFNIDEEMYLSESKTADRNRCLAYMMKEAGAFSDRADLERDLEFYFRCCSIKQNTESMSIVAGTLANGGCCPLTNERIFSQLTVQSVLAVMFTCGMYDYSGQWCFSMGFPAKSGVAGSILMVVPNVMGICTLSPRLDGNGNSCRGIAFAKCLADVYELHIFDEATETLRDSSKTKQDLRFRPHEEIRDLWAELTVAVISGDLPTVHSFAARYGPELLNMSDYDQRTALHLACSEGRYYVVKHLIALPGIKIAPIDRWGMSPLDDARKNGTKSVISIMEHAMRHLST